MVDDISIDVSAEITTEITADAAPIVSAILSDTPEDASPLLKDLLKSKSDFYSGLTTDLLRQKIEYDLAGQGIFLNSSAIGQDKSRSQKELRKDRAMQSIIQIADQQRPKALNDKIDKAHYEIGRSLYLIDQLELNGFLTPEQAAKLREELIIFDEKLKQAQQDLNETKEVAKQNKENLSIIRTTLEEKGLYLEGLTTIEEIDAKAVVITLELPEDTAKAGRYIVFKDENGEYQIKITTQNTDESVDLIDSEADTILPISSIEPESLRQSTIESITAQEAAGKSFGNDLPYYEANGYNKLLGYMYRSIENYNKDHPDAHDQIGRENFVELLDALDKVATSKTKLSQLEKQIEHLLSEKAEILQNVVDQAIENGAAQEEINRIEREYDNLQLSLTAEQTIIAETSTEIENITARIKQNVEDAKEVQEEVTETREEIIEGLQAKYASTDRKKILTSNYEDFKLGLGRNLLGLAKNIGITVDTKEHALEFMEKNPDHKLTQAWNNYITAEVDGVTRPLTQDEAGILYWVDINDNNKEHLLDTKYYPEKYALAYDPDKPRFWFDETPMHPRFAEGFREKLDADKQLTTAQALADTEVWVAENQENRANKCATTNSDEKLSECMSAFQDASAARAPEIIQEMAIDTLTSWKQNIEDVTNSIRVPNLFNNKDNTDESNITLASTSLGNQG